MNIPATKLRAALPELLNRVTYQGERVVITKNNKPAAVLIPLEDAARLERLEDEEGGKLALVRLKEKGRVPYAKVRAASNMRMRQTGANDTPSRKDWAN